MKISKERMLDILRTRMKYYNKTVGYVIKRENLTKKEERKDFYI